MLRPHEWLLTDLAARLGMQSVTLSSWMNRGWVKGRQLEDVRLRRPWVIKADARELERLAVLRTAPKHRWPRTRVLPART